MAIELQNEKAFQKQFGVFVGKQRLLGKGDEKEIRYFKDIGLGYKTPKAAIEGTYVDHKCPFTSSVSIRGRILTGIVKSTKMQRTVIVRRDYLHFIPKYSRYEKRHRNIPAHCSPCFNVKEGDRVVIGQCRPLSKTVRFNVIKVVDTKKKKVSTRRARRIAQIRKGIARGTYTRKRVVKATKDQKPGAKKAKKVVKKSAPVLDQKKLMKKVQKKLNKTEKKEEKAKDTKKGAKGKQPAKGKKQAPAKKVATKPVKKEEKPVAKKQEAKKQTPAKKEQPKKQAPAKKEQPKKAEPKKQTPTKKEQPKKAVPAKKEQPKKQVQPKKTQPKANASKKATKK